MLLESKEKPYKSFPNYLRKEPDDSVCQIYSLGWQMRTSKKYSWDGLKRAEEKGQCIFQYTLSGTGCLDYENGSVILDEGSAFLVQLPDDHRYYLPENSEKWEFIFITLTGEYAIKQWTKIQQKYGKVIRLSKKSDALRFWWKSYWKFNENADLDEYETSAVAYEFIMQLLRSLEIQKDKESLEKEAAIMKAVDFMKHNYQNQLCLDDLAQAAQISKYHFSRRFTLVMGMTPWDYLTRIRMEKSAHLLQTHAFKVYEVAEMVGFTSVNYFNKVFKKTFGTSPAKFELMYTGTDQPPELCD